MKIDEIDLNKEYKAIELLNLIRARTLHHMSQHFFLIKMERKFLSNLSYTSSLISYCNCYIYKKQFNDVYIIKYLELKIT